MDHPGYSNFTFKKALCRNPIHKLVSLGFRRANSAIASLALFGLASSRFIATRFRLKLNNDADHFPLGPLEPLLPDVTRLVPTHNIILQKSDFSYPTAASQCESIPIFVKNEN